MSTSPPSIRVTAVTVSTESTSDRPKRLISGALRVGPREYKLKCASDETLHLDFSNLELSPEVRITLSYLKSQPFSRTKTQTIDTQRLLMSEDLSVAQDGIRITFIRQATGTASNTESFVPITGIMLKDCPRLRILVIGKSGVGKSSLINSVFGINKASASNLHRGGANIQVGLQTPANERLILHDSCGFEPGETDNYATVKDFIRGRQTGLLRDQLHAIWFCIKAPRAGDRLLEVAAEDFFRSKKETVGAIPIIVVYTKFDLLVNTVAMRKMTLPSGGRSDEESVRQQARSEAESIVNERHDEVIRFAGDPVLHAAVSGNEYYKDTLTNLINRTYREVEIRDASHVTSAVTLMAQRVDDRLKIQGSIDVGKRKYWKALRASPNFQGHTIWECLSVIHADIVAVWNFNDPTCLLIDNKFKELVIQMVQEMGTGRSPTIGETLALSAAPVMVAVSGLAAIIGNPAPVLAGIAAVAWLFQQYQNVKNVQKIFMAFIVDMTHIMKTLFILTARDHNKLTRRAVKLACEIYHDSVMKQLHSDIREHVDGVGRDASLEMIECLIKPEQTGYLDVKNYYAELQKMDVRKLNLDKEEEW